MKYDDIEVGKEYAVGPDSFLRQATVVDKRPDVVVPVYRDRWTSDSAPSKRALVRFGSGTREEWVTPAQVKRPWAEQATINATKDSAAAAKKERVRFLSDAIGCKVTWSFRYGLEGGESNRYVTLPITDLERLVMERTGS